MKNNLLALLLFSITCACVTAQSQFTVAAPANAARMEKKPEIFRAFKPSKPNITNLSNLTDARRYATCANRPGVLQLGLGYAMTIGGGWVTVTDTLASFIEAGLGSTYNINFRFQIGVTEGLSLGFYARRDAGAYGTTKLESLFNGFTHSGFSFGFEGKGYPLNKDKFAVYIAPMVGASFASTTINDFEKDHAGKGVGFNYGISAGLNWYWTDAFGMSFDIGYTATSIAGLFDNVELSGLDFGMTYGGIFAGAGLVLKFDTRKY